MSAAPQSPEDLLERLRLSIDTMPRRLRQCAEYVAANPERIAVSTVAELAKGAGVQPSAFMRFCQELGFSGFSQMQKLFRKSYSQRWPDYQTRLENLRAEGGGSPQGLLAEFAEAGRASLEQLMHSVNAADLNRAVDRLTKADTIHVAGFRRAFPVAAYLVYAFEKMNVPAVLHSGVGNLGASHTFRRGDAMIAISFAPYTEQTVDMARQADKAGLSLIVMTDLVTSPLMQLKCTPLMISEIDVDAFRTLSATLSLAMTLAVAVGARRAPGEGRGKKLLR